MRNTFFMLLMVACLATFAKPVSKARLSLESGTGKALIACQLTGETGSAVFGYLDKGYYQLLVEFPQQEGKYIKETSKHSTLTKVTYNGKKRTYYYQGIEGFFSVTINGLKGINKESLQAVFRERHKEDKLQILMAKFEAVKQGASVTLTVEAITAAQFKKATDKLGSDISTISIQGVK
jgi:hypothetical protein